MENATTTKAAYLKGLSSPIQDRVFPVTGNTIRIGRKEGIEVQIKGNGISRVHAQIHRCPEGWELIDLKSTNGTYVNRKMVSSKILVHSDFIQIGDAELLFETDPSSSTPNPSRHYPNDEAFYLIGLTDTLDGQTFPLEKETITIGRLSENDIVIGSKSISGYHAEIKLDHGVYFLIDLNSTNGTYLNGSKVDQQEIRAGDIIRINNFNFKVGCGDYKFAHTGTIINQKAESTPEQAKAVQELEENKNHPSYVNLKTTGLFPAAAEADESRPETSTAKMPILNSAPKKGRSKLVWLLVFLIVVLLAVVSWMIFNREPVETGQLDRGTQLAWSHQVAYAKQAGIVSSTTPHSC